MRVGIFHNLMLLALIATPVLYAADGPLVEVERSNGEPAVLKGYLLSFNQGQLTLQALENGGADQTILSKDVVRMKFLPAEAASAPSASATTEAVTDKQPPLTRDTKPVEPIRADDRPDRPRPPPAANGDTDPMAGRRRPMDRLKMALERIGPRGRGLMLLSASERERMIDLREKGEANLTPAEKAEYERLINRVNDLTAVLERTRRAINGGTLKQHIQTERKNLITATTYDTVTTQMTALLLAYSADDMTPNQTMDQLARDVPKIADDTLREKARQDLRLHREKMLEFLENGPELKRLIDPTKRMHLRDRGAIMDKIRERQNAQAD